ncbi:DUF1405 domain-containing protein [Tumebacillus flagellatus]|uniref:DUF1405 domain-containing protein n=1 Tax=Tumebacillus flagellatus TaxID=1157490 RepID=A0A074LUI6_9BACL|nr:DUF1405 domain-containing protein [Tumebacillus flagellatus]KEO84250.1 hypothetical protein EL26_05655 [Tumebacillus flagellatus]
MNWSLLKHYLLSRSFLWLLFLFNFLGSIYGFYWYGNQMAHTEWYWNFFVPDSPTSSSLFTIVVLLWLLGKRSKVLEMLSMVTNLKYGIWAVGVIITYWNANGRVDATDLMLMISHGAMAVEVVLYNFNYKFDNRVLWIGACWLLFNDFVDYVYTIHPWLQDERFTAYIQFWTPVLSLLVLTFTAFLRRERARSK